MFKRFIYFVIIGIVLLAGGIVIGVFGIKSKTPSDTPSPTKNIASANTPANFINPTVTSNLNKHFIIDFSTLKKDLVAIQGKFPQKTYLYFNYLNNASWIGLNERDMFVAASTIKVPLAMALFKAVEEGKLKLTDGYTLEEIDLDDKFGELYKVGLDKSFTVEGLVKIMLEMSDNTASRGILNIFLKIGIEDPLTSVYNFMGWEGGDIEFLPEMGQAINYQDINLKILSNMFLALYNATYVNIEHSQKILQYLANTPFNNKMAAGIPDDITVAHKIGVSSPDKTFSDCGIIYAPNRQYLLCLGLNGGDEKVAASFMAEVSKTVYQFVINN